MAYDSDPSSTPPGWYHAEGDPAGTHRYWSGTEWVGGPQPVGSNQPQPAGGFGPAQGPPYGFGMRYESSQAIGALICSILGFFCCLLGPIGWYLGQQEIAAIDAGRRDPSNRSTANAARIVGALATALLVLLILFYVVALGASV